MAVEVDELYQADVVAWSQQQSDLLRRFANAAQFEPAFRHGWGLQEPDWANIIEEIESVGRSELRAVGSHLRLAMLHELTVRAWPNSIHVSHWAAEVRQHRRLANRLWRASMHALDVDELYQTAKAGIPDQIDGLPHGAFPERCPWRLNELLEFERALP